MSVCTTCLKPGLPADGQHDCPGLGDIQLTRQLGRGIRVDTAPARARMALTVFADHGHGLAMQGADMVNIADQVLYQVVGYDAESAALVLELVEDWRPVRAPDEDDEEPTGPAKPGIQRCTATWETEHQGTAHCWRAATHNQREGYETHMGEAEHGYRFQWIGTEPGATPHQPDPADAAVCTPIPGATLRQMSEVPAELLTEQQLGRPENALERLRLARQALIADGYFTADEVGADIAPRIVEWLSHHRGRVEKAEAEVARLTAGEEPGWDPLVVPTPGQWIARWNSLRPTERLALAQAVIEAAETTNRCHFEGHRQRLEEDQEAWVALARVRDVLADMERITGARHWARILRKAVDGKSGAEDATATRPKPCAAVHPVDPSAHCDKPGDHDDGEHSGETNYLHRVNWSAEPSPGFVPFARPEHIARGETSADPLVVEPYRNDRGESAWVFRCWGTATCDGWLSLDRYSQESAELVRDRHVREEHATKEKTSVPDRKRILIDPPGEAVILAARHLDATEGRVQVGGTVDAPARSAITCVLNYIAKAHNSPAASAEQQGADGHHKGAERVRALHVRNPYSGTCEHCSAGDYPDYAVPSPCPTIRALNGEEPKL